jgi:hypothetical protein
VCSSSPRPLDGGSCGCRASRPAATLVVEQVSGGSIVQTAVERSRTHHPDGTCPSPVVTGVPRERLASLDNLELLMVAAILAVHGVIGYRDFEGALPYQEVREVQQKEASSIVLGMLLLPSLLFVTGLFFLISELLTPGSLERKGPERLRPRSAAALGRAAGAGGARDRADAIRLGPGRGRRDVLRRAAPSSLAPASPAIPRTRVVPSAARLIV